MSLFKKMGMKSPFIIQAPMAGGITTPQLVAAVSNANGLGSFATGYLDAEQTQFGIREIKALTTLPFAVNLFIPNKATNNVIETIAYQKEINKYRRQLGLTEESGLPENIAPTDDFNEVVDVVLKEKIKVVSFTFGCLNDELIQAFKANKTYLIGTATSIEEAKILEEIGVDAVVAQGHEAGGHRGGFFTPFKQSSIGTMALIPQIANHVTIPIIAAGGIMDGRGILAAQTLGASAVQMGTAFLTTLESGANKVYKQALLKMREQPRDVTRFTRAYSGKQARAIDSTFMKEMEHYSGVIPPYPIPNQLTSPIRKAAAKQAIPELMSLWCGQGLPQIRDKISATVLLDTLHMEIDELNTAHLAELTHTR